MLKRFLDYIRLNLINYIVNLKIHIYKGGAKMTSHVTFQQGVKECIPTLLGYIGIGLSFGIVAASQDFSVLEILLLCLLVYAGAAQFIICALVITGTPISAIVLTTLIVNSRFFLLSMTLSPNYKDYGIWNRLALSSILTDETFGVAITPHLKGETINDRWLHGCLLYTSPSPRD